MKWNCPLSFHSGDGSSAAADLKRGGGHTAGVIRAWPRKCLSFSRNRPDAAETASRVNSVRRGPTGTINM
jgi:hypothetical protein